MDVAEDVMERGFCIAVNKAGRLLVQRQKIHWWDSPIARHAESHYEANQIQRIQHCVCRESDPIFTIARL